MHADLLVSAARSCLGTRFRHQGRSAAHGVDCVGLIIIAARQAGFRAHDMLGYGRQPQPEDFNRYIRKNGLLEVVRPRAGDVGLFDFGHGPQHAALFTARGIIHAYAPARKVIEHGFQAPWPQRLCGLYRFPPLLHRE